MDFAYGGRRSGKTEWLVRRAAENGGIIIVANEGMARSVFETARHLGLDIRYPITVREHLQLSNASFYKGRFSVPVLIDELGLFLAALDIYNVDSFTLDVSMIDIGDLPRSKEEWVKANPALVEFKMGDADVPKG